MTKEQEKYLELAVIDQMKFDEISTKMPLERKLVSMWWDELKEGREKLSEIRRIWKTKFPEDKIEDSFYDFKEWYEQAERKCHYCEITEADIKKLDPESNILTKRNRGEKLEIERLEPNELYSNLGNLVYSCYWCNNAKTDTFTADEFKRIGKVIGEIWKNRLAK